MSEEYSDARALLDAHPALREAMNRSSAFAELKRLVRGPFEIDGESVFLLYGDAGQVSEDELFTHALRVAVVGTGESEFERVARSMLLQLDPPLQKTVRRTFGG
jgi:hypothetical protein